MSTVEIIVACTSIIVALCAYLSLRKNSAPQLLVYYQPSPDTPSCIDLIIENNGGGMATNVIFSTPLPIHCFGIKTPSDDGSTTAPVRFPAISPKQRYTFNGGQFGGLRNKIGQGITSKISYEFTEPLGFTKKVRENIKLGIDHLANMPSRISAEQAIVDALKSSNKTTVHEIRDELKAINRHLAKLSSQHSEHDTNS